MILLTRTLSSKASKALSVISRVKSKDKQIDWSNIPDYDLAVNPYKIAPGVIDRYTEQIKKVLEKNKSNK